MKHLKNSDLETKVESLRARVDALQARREPKDLAGDVPQASPNVQSADTETSLAQTLVGAVRTRTLPTLTVPIWTRDVFLVLVLAVILFDIARGQLELRPFRYIAPVIDPAQSYVSHGASMAEWRNYESSAISLPARSLTLTSLSLGAQQDVAPRLSLADPLVTLRDVVPTPINIRNWTHSLNPNIHAPTRRDPELQVSYSQLSEIQPEMLRPYLDAQVPNLLGLDHEVIGLVDKSRQRIQIFKKGVPLYEWDVSTARQGKTTPTGTWTAQWLSKDHKSSLYNNAPMPYSIFFSGHYAIHGTDAVDRLGSPASAGCVRLHPDNARVLFAMVQDVGKSNFAVRIIE